MKNKILPFFSFLLLFFATSFFHSEKVAAQTIDNNHLSTPICDIRINNISTPYTQNGNELPKDDVPLVETLSRDTFSANFDVTVNLNNAALQTLTNCNGQNGPLRLTSNTGGYNWTESTTLTKQPNGTFSGSFNIFTDDWTDWTEDRIVGLDVETPAGLGNCLENIPLCRRSYVRLDPDTPPEDEERCSELTSQLQEEFLSSIPPSASPGDTITITLPSYNFYGPCDLSAERLLVVDQYGNVVHQLNGEISFPQSFTLTGIGTYTVSVNFIDNDEAFTDLICVADGGNCVPPTPTPTETPTEKQPYYICNQLKENSEEKAACCKCATGNERCTEIPDRIGGVWTAIGCIETEPTLLVGAIMRVALSLAGGVTILVILAAGFLFSTSQGDPKRTSEAKEMMTSAVVGLLFIIFSVTILQFIGVDVLQIPGFGTP